MHTSSIIITTEPTTTTQQQQIANETWSVAINITFPTETNISDWGPKRDPLTIVIPITIIYILTFVSGVLGNVSTCIVISRNKSMHTATNYYLFSLAISDLLLLVSGLPPEIYAIWSKYPYIFGEAFCILQGFAAETSANATVLTITAFTVERYVAICHPFLSHTLSKLNRAIKFIVAIWVVAMCLAVPQAMAFGLWYERNPGTNRIVDDHCVCIVKRSVIPHAFEISTFVFFVAPMSLITVLYVLIGLQLHRSTVRPSRGNSVRMKHRVYKPVCGGYGGGCNSAAVVVVNGESNNAEKQQQEMEEDGRKNFAKNAQATKHVVKMLIAVVVAFFICWAPFHAQRLLAIYGKHTSAGMIRAFQVLTYVSGVFYYLSTTVNPLLYHIMSHKFREAFKNTYKQCFRRGHHTPGGRCYSTLSGRSSQVNSHSNTDSYSRQSSLRYLDAEMARLHDSRRPLVVSFRRKTAAAAAATTAQSSRHCLHSTTSSGKQVTIFDHDIEKALASLNYRGMTCQDGDEQQFVKSQIFDDCCRSIVQVHQLRPTHICPLLINNHHHERDNIDAKIKVFQEEKFRLNLQQFYEIKPKKRSESLKLQETSDRDDEENGNESRIMIKSCTMPDIKQKYFNNGLNVDKIM